jgi:hypothetical protein
VTDPLLEDDPWVKEKVAEGILKGKAKGELEAFKRILCEIVQTCFPALSELAEATAERATQPGTLNVLVVQISAASDEQAARTLLEGFAAS